MNADRRPRVFGTPPGASFADCVFDRLREISREHPPEYLAKIDVLLPSRRMQRRLKHLFEQSGNFLLPRIGLVGDIRHLLPQGRQISPVSSLRRTLDLKAVVAQLVEHDDRLPASAIIDLTISLTRLFDEMQGEGVDFEQIKTLSPDDQSGHWARNLEFLRAIRDYAETLEDDRPDPEALHRKEVEALVKDWARQPPNHPVILAGSTGSRATTRLLMKAVAALPYGEIILPGFDFDLPADIWEILQAGRKLEDHPQFRLASVLSDLDVPPADVARLGNPPVPSRNALISLSLRPAPVTNAWLSKGPSLDDPALSTDHLTLVETRDAKQEAAAIAFVMRAALEKGHTVALVAPDATLARRVSVNLARWGITPDDSGGTPLSLSPLGRFLRHTAAMASGRLDPVGVLSLLKHPLTRSGDTRGDAMRRIQEFELFARKNRLQSIQPEDIRHFGIQNGAEDTWIDWLEGALRLAAEAPRPTSSAAFEHHMRVSQAFACRPLSELNTSSDANERIFEILRSFRDETSIPTQLSFIEYAQILDRFLSTESAREQDGIHPNAMIWGPLEARVQGADVVILGGMNEGTWPAQSSSDPWLNRSMRRQAGLLLPERQIGLAAHDYQQAVGARNVIISRSARADGSETVPSRWLSRLVNLLEGLKTSNGPKALARMRARGAAVVAAASKPDSVPGIPKPARRPAPSPPTDTRPRRLAVTDIQTLIRDPYAIYAKRILRLRPIDPLVPEMDARLRGTVFHKILEDFFDPAADFDDPERQQERLVQIAADILAKDVPDVTARAEWLGQFIANADWLIAGEVGRRQFSNPIGRELNGEYAVPDTTFTLVGKADRIDRQKDGRLIIYDYKTGKPPSHKDILRYDRQLVLEAAMAEAGAFPDIAPEAVSFVCHLGVGRTPEERITKLADANDLVTNQGHLANFLNALLDPEFGYLSCRATETQRFEGDYDHLARFGEWDISWAVEPERLR